MIEITRGDILTANAEALVNTVNCVGVMGRGIALQFRKAFPENFKVYESACEREEVRPGRILIFETGLLTGPRYVINFPTKRQDLGGCVRHRAAEAGSEIVIDCRRRPRGIRWCGYSVAALDVPAPPRSPRKRLTGETGSENYCRLAKVQMPGLRTDRHQPSQHKIVPLLPLRSPNPQPRLPTRRFSLLFRYGFCFGRRYRLLCRLGFRRFASIRRGGGGTLHHVEAEHRREILASQTLVCRRCLLPEWRRLARAGEQFQLVHATQSKQQLRLVIKPRADAIKHRRNMLAHVRPVRATARKQDLRR